LLIAYLQRRQKRRTKKVDSETQAGGGFAEAIRIWLSAIALGLAAAAFVAALWPKGLILLVPPRNHDKPNVIIRE
jgi:hypothetical protein